MRVIEIVGFFHVINFNVSEASETSETYTHRTDHKPLPLQ